MNRLKNSISPYLLQHANNPVDWRPWCSDAFSKAKEENKLIIISIGYSACHWCHVMEKESFEDIAVAEMMNSHFVSIKVDREERPDVDQVYMTAAMIISGRGGWPLNAIALPDGRAVFAGTYFKKNQWLQVLAHFSNLYLNRQQDLEEIAGRIHDGIFRYEEAGISSIPQEEASSLIPIVKIAEKMLAEIDPVEGGINKSPKFPMPSVFHFLLRCGTVADHNPSAAATRLTLTKMFRGGIFDHIGGGFSRYSTDEYWLVPHFEKMLYDNAQLLSLYSEGWAAFKTDEYKTCANKIIGFLKTELSCESGGYYSALDADSEGEEGKFYTWEYQEILDVLDENASVFMDYFGVEPFGNWDGKNVLHIRPENPDAFLREKNEDHEYIVSCIDKLNKKRRTRIRPGLDNKIITCWNSLLLSGLCDATRYEISSETNSMAKDLANFLLQNSIVNNSVIRIVNSTEKERGCLDDYASLANAFIAMYQISGEEKWVTTAKQICEWAIELFYDYHIGLFYYSSASDLPNKLKEISDNVISSSNSMMGHLLFDLSRYYYNDEWREMSIKMLQTVAENADKNWCYHANWAMLSMKVEGFASEIIFCGSDAKEVGARFIKTFYPNSLIGYYSQKTDIPVVASKKSEGGLLIYFCRGQQCYPPVSILEDLEKIIIEKK